MVEWQIEAERQREIDWRGKKKSRFEQQNGADKFSKEVAASQEEKNHEEERNKRHQNAEGQ